jgi:hypothetical protein
MRQESNDVMLGFRLDRINAGYVENGVFAHGPDFLGRSLRHNAKFRHGIGSMGLNLKPDPETRLRLPDMGHFRP